MDASAGEHREGDLADVAGPLHHGRVLVPVDDLGAAPGRLARAARRIRAGVRAPPRPAGLTRRRFVEQVRDPVDVQVAARRSRLGGLDLAASAGSAAAATVEPIEPVPSSTSTTHTGTSSGTAIREIARSVSAGSSERSSEAAGGAQDLQAAALLADPVEREMNGRAGHQRQHDPHARDGRELRRDPGFVDDRREERDQAPSATDVQAPARLEGGGVADGEHVDQRERAPVPLLPAHSVAISTIPQRSARNAIVSVPRPRLPHQQQRHAGGDRHDPHAADRPRRAQFRQQRAGGAQQRPDQVQAARDGDRPVGFAIGRSYLGWSPGAHLVPVSPVLAAILTYPSFQVPSDTRKRPRRQGARRPTRRGSPEDLRPSARAPSAGTARVRRPPA